MRNSTPSQDRVMKFIESEIASGRGFPSREAIRDHMGWRTVQGCREVLMALAARGRIARQFDGRRWKFEANSVECES